MTGWATNTQPPALETLGYHVATKAVANQGHWTLTMNSNTDNKIGIPDHKK